MILVIRIEILKSYFEEVLTGNSDMAEAGPSGARDHKEHELSSQKVTKASWACRPIVMAATILAAFALAAWTVNRGE